MPNAMQATGIQPHKFLVLGATGTGKTAQLLTLPGKKFAYLFDPNALLTLRGYDVDYEEFYPADVSLDVQSLSKDKGGDKVTGRSRSEIYLNWEKDFDSKVASGFFSDYDVIAMDSCTTLLDLIMDRILAINGRPGSWPQQDDYGPQMMTFTNIVRTLTGMGKMIYFTGHLELEKDELSQTIYRVPVMTGKLKSKIPLLFSDIFATDVVNDGKGKVVYTIQTVSDRRTPTIRCSLKGLEPHEDVTIDWNKLPEGQGIGGLLKWEQKESAKKLTTK
jgi:hypothetical protein